MNKSDVIAFYPICEDVLETIKATINERGYWDGDYNNWNEIVAVCNLESLLVMGVTFNEKWHVAHNNFSYVTCLDNIISYLDGQMIVGEKGQCTFGEDIWDMFRLMNLIKSFNLQNRFPKYRTFSSYCRKIIAEKKLSADNRWEGVGIKAVAYRYARENNLRQHAEIKSDILATRNEDFSWGTTSDPKMLVWHTSQVIVAISRYDILPDVDKSLQKIYNATRESAFTTDYFLKTYYLCYAALAFIYTNRTDSPMFQDILNDVIAYARSNMGNRDRGNISMVGEMFAALLLRFCNTEAKIINQLLRSKELEASIEETLSLKHEIAELTRKIKDQSQYFFVHRRIVKIIGWIVLTIMAAIITGLITVLINRFLGKN